jgi:hypothetical protein
VPDLSAVRHLVRYNQMMFGVDSDLHVIADDARAAAARCHRTTVGIGPRDLPIGRSKHLLLVDIKLAHLLLQLCQLLGEPCYLAASASVGSCRSAVSSWLR